MAFENPYLVDFARIFFGVIREKGLNPAKVEVIVFDEGEDEHQPFERIGVQDVLNQLRDDINALTIFTDRPQYFEKFAEQAYEENGLLVIMKPKREQCRAVWQKADDSTCVVLDFEWNGACYRPDNGACKGYIPIHKKAWEMRENLDILVPFGYNTVIVKSNHTRDTTYVRDRFDEGFYRDE